MTSKWLATGMSLLAALALAMGPALADAQQNSDSGPTPLHIVPPTYPPLARLTGADGTAVVCFTVRADGSTTDVRVKSFPAPHTHQPQVDTAIRQEFALSITNAAKKWKFSPRTAHGKSVSTPNVCQPLVFSLKGTSPTLGPVPQSSYRPYPVVRYKPYYPVLAQEERVTGGIRICFKVSAMGQVSDPEIVATHLHPPAPKTWRAMEKSAMSALAHWIFLPVTKNGKPVTVHACQTLEFLLG